MLTQDIIFDLLRRGEKVTRECKRASHKLPNSVWETYSAMANTYGGTILLGIDEVKSEKDWRKRYPVVGLADAEKLRMDFWNLLNDSEKVNLNLLIDDDVEIVKVEGKEIIAIHVPQADYHQKPVFVNGNMNKGTYKRNHEGDYHCKESELRAMIRDASDEGNDGRRLPYYGMDDIDVPTLREYRQMFMNRNPDHSLNRKDDKEFLRQMGAYVEDRASGEGGLTMAGLLMFGKGLSIRERFDMIRFDYVDKTRLTKGQRYRDRLTYDGDWENNLFRFLTMVMPRLTRDLPVPFVLEGVQRVDDTPMHKLLREAMTNMIIHADFMAEGILKVEKRDDGYLFSNPGTLKLPVEEIYRGGVSAARNPHIQDLLRMIGYGDNLGTGFPEMVEVWENAWGEKPMLNERYELQIVELSFGGMNRDEGNPPVNPENPPVNSENPPVNSENLPVNSENLPVNPENLPVNPENLPVNLGELDKHILMEMMAKPKLTYAELATLVGRTRETIRIHIKSLKEKGLIVRVGSDKDGYWKVVDNSK